ncbi:hypothetical protein [Thalassococcus sp. S3]|uniref:hypothetical protein n=1 Tax=Thalassococcus sp. S3 TaxID=2017482 RepID=UPI00102BD938|nr:hypothetical protein [Thalassococcus sp. S3]
MAPAIQNAAGFSRTVNFSEDTYLVSNPLVFSSNRTRLIGVRNTRLLFNQGPNANAGIWFASSSPEIPGTLGPSNCLLRNMIIQSVYDDLAIELQASIRCTVTTGMTFENVSFRGGAPSILLEGARNTTIDNCGNVATNTFTQRQEAIIKQTFWVYSDDSVEKGFTTRISKGSWSSSSGNGYQYEAGLLIEVSDGTLLDDWVYFGRNLIDVLVRPLRADAACSGIRIGEAWLDDGGAADRFLNTNLKLDATAASGVFISEVFSSGGFFTNNLTAVEIAAGPGNVQGLSVSGGAFINVGGDVVRITDSDTSPRTNIFLSGVQILTWAAVQNGSIISANNASHFSLSNVVAKGPTNGTTASVFSSASGNVRLARAASCSFFGTPVIVSQLDQPNFANIDISSDCFWSGGDVSTFAERGENLTSYIVETGSDIDGKYEKYSDGTLKCWHKIDLGSIAAEGTGTFDDPYRSAAIAWTFPIPFVAPPDFVRHSVSVEGSGNRLRQLAGTSHRTQTETQATGLVAYRIGSRSDPDIAVISVEAAGRWR